jgi:hypothetical protein
MKRQLSYEKIDELTKKIEEKFNDCLTDEIRHLLPFLEEKDITECLEYGTCESISKMYKTPSRMAFNS